MILEYKESKGQWHYNMVRDFFYLCTQTPVILLN